MHDHKHDISVRLPFISVGENRMPLWNQFQSLRPCYETATILQDRNTNSVLLGSWLQRRYDPVDLWGIPANPKFAIHKPLDKAMHITKYNGQLRMDIHSAYIFRDISRSCNYVIYNYNPYAVIVDRLANEKSVGRFCISPPHLRKPYRH